MLLHHYTGNTSRKQNQVQTMRIWILLANLLFVQSHESIASPVKVVVCTEALCPDCENFIQTQVVPVYSKLGSDVMDLSIIPFGNAHHFENGTTVCQHGQGECDANVYELCAKFLNPDPKDHLPFLDCLTRVLPMGYHDEPFDESLFEQCAENIWWPGVKACHESPHLTRRIIDDAVAATPKDHKYVPWITIEGTHLDEERYDFETEICRAFISNGGSHPGCEAKLISTSA
jgi:interferon, gamma-inducible protein 30